jgi:hypothetical protein
MMKGMLALPGLALVAGFIVGGGGLPAGAVVGASKPRATAWSGSGRGCVR